MNTLITGASSGIGEALAYASALRGNILFLSGRDKMRLEAVAEKCEALGSPAVYAEVVDVTDAAAMNRWIRGCDEIAPLDRVFANAGVSTGEENEVNVRATFATNVNGVVNTVLPAVKRFTPRHHGEILLTASIAGYGPLSACPSYSATKACVRTWGLALRGSLRPLGISVSVICPGFVRSRITDRNTCPMPFFMEAEAAAKRILAGADRHLPVISFPWPLRLGAWFLGMLPFRLAALVTERLPKKNFKGKVS